MRRSIGPVTSGATMGTAAAVLVVGLAARLGLVLSVEEAGAVSILGAGLGGLLVRPGGRHVG